MKNILSTAVAFGLSVGLLLMSNVASATSIYLMPTSSIVNLNQGTVTQLLFMDFSDDATLGGGIDLTINGPVSLKTFVPSIYFMSLDPSFRGFSTDPGITDRDLAIWFGDFNGLGGVNELGTIELNLAGIGTAALGLGINSLFGPFQSASTFDTQNVQLIGSLLDITSVDLPSPSSLWLLIGGGLGILAWRRHLSLSPCLNTIVKQA